MGVHLPQVPAAHAFASFLGATPDNTRYMIRHLVLCGDRDSPTIDMSTNRLNLILSLLPRLHWSLTLEGFLWHEVEDWDIALHDPYNCRSSQFSTWLVANRIQSFRY